MTDRAEAWFGQAQVLHRQGNLAGALPLYEKVAKKRPRDARVLFMLGTVKAQMGKPEAAVPLLKKAAALSPDNAGVHTNLGNVLKATNDPEGAADCYRKALSVDPDSALALSNLGSVLNVLQQPEEAEDCCRKAIALQPGMGEAYLNLGVALKATGRLEEAAGAYQHALSLSPRSSEGYCNLGNVYADLDRIDEAIDCYLKAVDINPGDHDAYANLGNICYDTGRKKEAVEYYEKALALNPEIREAQINYGLALSHMGDAHRQALQDLLSEDHIYKDMEEPLALARKLAETVPLPAGQRREPLMAALDDLDPAVPCPHDWWQKKLASFGPARLAGDKLFRGVYCRVFSWSIASREAIEAIAGFAGDACIASYGAGGGYWEFLLARQGCNVTASDITLGRRFVEMDVIDFGETTPASEDVIMLAWIPNSEKPVAAALHLFEKMHAGQKLVLVGDMPDRHGRVHTCGTPELFDALQRGFTRKNRVDLPRFAYLNDAVDLYTRNG